MKKGEESSDDLRPGILRALQQKEINKSYFEVSKNQAKQIKKHNEKLNSIHASNSKIDPKIS